VARQKLDRGPANEINHCPTIAKKPQSSKKNGAFFKAPFSIQNF
jgi:hypothetical protein